jgi:glycosyltransferase involved in cell wall biosynthesis
LSHNKPAQVGEAIGSLVAQTFGDWEAVVFDSGVLYDQGFFDELVVIRDPRIRLVRSWETEKLRKTKTIASWRFNECFRKKLVNGSYVVYLCDDDLLYPNAFQGLYDHVQSNPSVMAMYGSADMMGVTSSGQSFRINEIVADEIRGSCCGGGPIDSRLNGSQMCHKAELLSRFPDDEPWPEDKEALRHADSVFWEKVGRYVPIYPVKVKIVRNRKVFSSMNEGGERLDLLYNIRCLEEANQQLRQTVAHLEAERQHAQAALGSMRYRLVDTVHATVKRLPLAVALTKGLLGGVWKACKAIRRSLEPGSARRRTGATLTVPARLAQPTRTEEPGEPIRASGHAQPAPELAPIRPLRERPHVLFVTEKWCDADPRAGVTNMEHNLFGSMEVAQVATYERWHFDEYYHKHGQTVDARLIAHCREHPPDALVITCLFRPDIDLQPATLDALHRLGIPLVFVSSDSVLEERSAFMDQHVMPYAALHVIWDTTRFTTRHPERCLAMWTPQDTRYYRDTGVERNIGVTFLGTMSGYRDRHIGINALRREGIEVFQAGGQRQCLLSLEGYAGILRRSKIVLNFSSMREKPHLHQAKGRIFEATLCGALLLDSANDQTQNWFEPMVEYVPFIDERDLVARAKYYLEHHSERQQIARAGWSRATSQYSPRAFWATIFQRIGIMKSPALPTCDPCKAVA